MDFRIARMLSPQTKFIVEKSGTCRWSRDFSKKLIERDGGSKVVNIKFVESNPYDDIVTQHCNRLDDIENHLGPEYRETIPRRDTMKITFADPLDYSFAAGIAHLTRYDPNCESIRLMWWALSIDDTVDARLDELSEFNTDPIPGVRKSKITLLGETYEFESKDKWSTSEVITGLTYVDLMPDGTGNLVFESDRNPFNRFIGYIPVEFSGRPSRLRAIHPDDIAKAISPKVEEEVW